MNLNVLKPKQAVESCFEKPNPAIAFVLVLVASIISFAQPLVIGVQPKLENLLLGIIVPGYVYFVLLVVIIYVIGFIFKGKEAVKGKFGAIVSAVGLMWVPIIVALLVLTAAIPFILTPLTVGIMQDLASGKITGEMAEIEIAYLVGKNSEAVGNDLFAYIAMGSDELVNYNVLVPVMIIFGLIGLFNLLLLYKIVGKVFQFKPVANIVAMLVVLAILGISINLIPMV